MSDPTPTPTPTATPAPTSTPIVLTAGMLPPGAVIDWPGLDLPDGDDGTCWTWCNGAPLSAGDYPLLMAAYGTHYGAGYNDGMSFNLPDCRGRVTVGAGWGASLTARNVGDQFGAETHQLTIAQMPAHSHTHSIRAGATGFGFSAPAQANISGSLSTQADSSVGGNQPHNNIQPSLALNRVIWTGNCPLTIATSSGGDGGGDYSQLPTPAPNVVYTELTVGETTQPVAFSYSIDAGQVMISLLLFSLLVVMLFQFVFRLRRQS